MFFKSAFQCEQAIKKNTHERIQVTCYLGRLQFGEMLGLHFSLKLVYIYKTINEQKVIIKGHGFVLLVSVSTEV